MAIKTSKLIRDEQGAGLNRRPVIARVLTRLLYDAPRARLRRTNTRARNSDNYFILPSCRFPNERRSAAQRACMPFPPHLKCTLGNGDFLFSRRTAPVFSPLSF